MPNKFGDSDDRFLGRRLLRAAKLARWELQIERAIHRALANRQRAVMGELHDTLTAAGPPDAFDLDTWSDELARTVEPVAHSVFAEIRDDVVTLFPDDPTNLPVIGFENHIDRMLGHMEGLGVETAANLNATLEVGTNKGESIPKLRNRVQDVFQSSEYRATTIARTETVGASNVFSHEAARAMHEYGSPLEKTWLATGDNRTRPTHRMADGDTVAFDAEFIVGDCKLQHPHDPAEVACPQEIVNCRCVCTYDLAGTASLPEPEPVVPEVEPWKWGDIRGDPFPFDYDNDGEMTLMAEDLFDHFSPWVQSLSAAERDAVQVYTSMGYESMNKALREAGGDLAKIENAELRAKIEALQNALAKAPQMFDPVVVYRGMSMSGQVAEGELFAWLEAAFPKGGNVKIDGFISTSPFSSFPEDIGEGTNGVMFEIEAHRGAFVMELSENPEEGEWLMQHGSSFEVVDVIKRGWRHIVRLREVP